MLDVAEMAVGWDVSEARQFMAHFERESEYFGNPGIHRWALGSINVAMWDAHARGFGLPVWRLFEPHADCVPLYGSGGWLSYSLDELVAGATGYVSRGFRAVKIKVGSPALEIDVDRLARVREAVGPDLNIMMDANQGMTLPSASAIERNHMVRGSCGRLDALMPRGNPNATTETIEGTQKGSAEFGGFGG